MIYHKAIQAPVKPYHHKYFYTIESGRTLEQTTKGGGACPDPFKVSDKIYRVSHRSVNREEDHAGMTR